MTGQRGRPVNEERQLALITGETTYRGKRCRDCNGVIRYAKSGSCVECTKDSSDKFREEARRAKRRRRRSVEADLADVLGLNANSEGVLINHAENADSAEGSMHEDASEITSELEYGTPRNAVEPISRQLNHTRDDGNSRDPNIAKTIANLVSLSVPDPDSAAGPMASVEQKSENDAEPADKIKTRYWCHPESGCVWTTPGTESESDGLVEEISAEAYADLVKAGFVEHPVNDDSDLEDILG